jgi:hypothetical protein
MPDHTPTKLKHAITLIRLIKGTVSLEMMDQNLNAVERILEGLAGSAINDTEPSQNRKLVTPLEIE